MVREFKLVNEKGQEFSLMDIENCCLLTDPSGLGYSYSDIYAQLGNTFISNLRRLEQGKIEGVANFTKYDNYKKLIDFIELSESLRFSYSIPFENGIKEYFRDTQIQSITKTQKSTNGIISESIIFDCLSLWYLATTANYSMETGDNEIRWDFRWDSSFSNYTMRSLTYINDGHVEAPVEISINGSVSCPVIELYIEGELYQSIPINIELSQFEKLLYGTKEDNFYLLKEEADGTKTDIFKLGIIDPKNDNVMRIPKGKSCEIRLIAENNIERATVIIYSYYKAV